MNDRKNKPVPPGRKAWIKGEAPTGEDAFAKRAERGRSFLRTDEEADKLLSELDAAIDDVYGRSDGQEEQIRRLPIRQLPYRMLGWAAAIVVLVVAGIWWASRPNAVNTEQLFVDQFDHFTNDLVVRQMGEEGSNANTYKQQALLDYEQRDYAGAREKIRQYFVVVEQPDSSLFLYLGISELAEGRVAEAEQSLLAALAFGYQPDAVAWYLALAKLREGRSADAKTDLQLIANGSSLFRDRAKRLLEQL
ncbi:MAG: hypothetical protein AAFU03_08240 [Bacteroidota bacterium]